MKKIKLIKTSFMQSQHYQTGAVLFVCLIFTMMITLLAVTAIRTSTLTERIAANSRDKSLAFQAAETALRDAESFLKSASGATATFNDSHGLYDSTDGTELSWSAVGGGHKAYSGILTEVTTQPEYMIELLPDGLISDGSIVAGKPKAGTGDMYRITSRGTGNSDTSIVMLQSIYRRR